jgi:hypothetical protein
MVYDWNILMMDNTDQTQEKEKFNTIIRAAERILFDLSGSAITFIDVQQLSEPDRRNLILRCTSSATPHFPSRFIIKKVQADVYDPEDASSWDTQRFFSDWAGSQFLSSLGGGANHGPHFYGGDRGLGFILLEDMGEHRSLVEPLMHEDAIRAEAALLRYSTRLGKLHADTVNRQDAYQQLINSVSPGGKPAGAAEQGLKDSIEKVKAILDHLEVTVEPAFIQEIHEIVRTVLDPGPFLVYIHGDPCPDNVFDSSEQLRLIDFEFSRYSHALIDAAYARMIFPTCWCANRLPQAIVEQMENHYRMELVRGCPQAQEDPVWEQALANICGYWLFDTLSWHLEPALAEDQSWGIASLRQRILARLEAFISASETFGHCPAVRAAAGRLLYTLDKRWTETESLPLYPAFHSLKP